MITTPGSTPRRNRAALLLLLVCAAFFRASAAGDAFFRASAAEAAAPSAPHRVTEEALPEAPGVYPAGDGNRLLVVGVGKITRQLQRPRAERLAVALAGRDARIRLARHLFPQEMDRGPTSLSLSGIRVLHQRVLPSDPWKMQVVLTVDPGEVHLAPYDPLQEYYEVNAAPFVAELLGEAPLLAEGGGRVFARENGWMVLGIGHAPLPDDPGWSAERAARTVARVQAEKALAAAVFGAEVTVTGQQREIVAEGPGGAALKEWAATRFSEEVHGALSHVLPAGEWKTLDGRLGVAVVAGSPTPEPFLQGEGAPEAEAARTPPPHFSVEADWREVILSRPWLFQGGLALYEREQSLWLLIAEGAPLSGKPSDDRLRLPVIIEAKARTGAVRFLSGATITGSDTESEQRLYDGVSNKEETSVIVAKIARENILGAVSGMKKIGEWTSEDGAIRYCLYEVRLQ